MIRKMLLAFVLIINGLLLNGQISSSPFKPIQKLPLHSKKSETHHKSLEKQITSYLLVNDELQLCTKDINLGENVDSLKVESDDIQILINLSLNADCIEIQSTASTGKDTISITAYSEGDSTTVRRIVDIRQPLTLPFAEDFSVLDPLPGYPNDSFWLDNDAYVNNHLASKAPSIGVVTLDGMDASGNAYNRGYAPADQLTSTFFDLSGYIVSDNVYLQFSYQAMGLGIPPEENDSLIVEFKDVNGQWNSVFYDLIGFRVNSFDTLMPFRFKALRLSAEYLHDSFQFRFKNYNQGLGLSSIWNVDYILLLDQVQDPGVVLRNDDIALASPPASLIVPYSAMPMSQFLGNEDEFLTDRLQVLLNNHYGREEELADAQYTILDEDDGNVIFGPRPLLETDRDGNPLGNISQGYQALESFIPNQLRPQIVREISEYVVNKPKVGLNLQYDLMEDGEENVGAFPFLSTNGRASYTTHISDYFAYDDGTAEIRYEMAAFNQIAIEFELKQADSLAGIMLLFPIMNLRNEGVDFQYSIHQGSLSAPAIYTKSNAKVSYPSTNRECPYFTYFDITDDFGELQNIRLDAGRFFIVLYNRRDILNLGVDRKFNSNAETYFNDNGNWRSFKDFFGGLEMSLMVRPFFKGHEKKVSTTLEGQDILYSIYPSPAEYRVIVPNANQSGSYSLYNHTGQLIDRGDLVHHSLDIHLLQSGQYFIQYEKSNTRFIESFIKK